MAGPAAVLRGFSAGVREPGAPGEQCELCAGPIDGNHPHLADVSDHRLLCSCRPCYLLFDTRAASRGRFRAVPQTFRYDPSFALSPAQWDALGIPVGLAFFFYQTDQSRYIAFYPSPGGATESLLDLGDWQAVVAASPALAGLIPDVEAALLRRVEERFECYLVPIDACYELVGIVRAHWQGFAGGDDVWSRIDEFFTGLRERAGG